jgi:hypothetical protein
MRQRAPKRQGIQVRDNPDFSGFLWHVGEVITLASRRKGLKTCQCQSAKVGKILQKEQLLWGVVNSVQNPYAF